MSDIHDLLDRYWQLAYAEGRENRQHDTENGDAQECRSAIEREIERLRKALEFYADTKKWSDCRFDNDEPGVLTLVPSTIDADNGKIARAALDAVKER